MNLQKKYITYNSLLKIINIALYILTIFFYTFNEMTILVNNYTLIIYSLLFLQIQLFLNHEKKYNNPFIVLLSFILIVYTYPRVLTFYWYNDNLPNLTLNRIIPTTVFDVNYSLFFIFISLFIGLNFSQSSFNPIIKCFTNNEQNNLFEGQDQTKLELKACYYIKQNKGLTLLYFIEKIHYFVNYCCL